MSVSRSLKILKNDNHCSHIQVEVDEQTRTVHCSSCERVMDAFDYILGWAKQERRFEMEVEYLKRQLTALHNEKIELSKEVSYMKKKAKDAKIKSLTGSQQ
jgi:hypothetical protein